MKKFVVLPKNRNNKRQLENNKLHFVTTVNKSKDTDNLISHEWDLTEQLDINYVLKQEGFESYKKVAKIIRNNNNACGYEIKVDDNFKDKKFVLYLIVINGKVLKGGKSKGVLSKRSYTAGTERSWSVSGKASEPNYVYSQIFRQCLEDEVDVEFYGICVESIKQTRKFYGLDVEVEFAPYEEKEQAQNSILNKLNGKKVIGEGNLLAQYKK
jgi:hypothetical protein